MWMGYSLEIEMVSCNQDCRHCYAKKDKEAYVRSLDWLQRQRSAC